MPKNVNISPLRCICLYNAIIKKLSFPALGLASRVNVLFMVRELNDKRIQCNVIRLSITLAYNNRAGGRGIIYKHLTEFVKAGYVTASSTSYNITPLGRDRLAAIDAALSRAKVRVLKADNLY